MCGVVGIFNRGHNPPPRLDVVEAMLARVHHRGPDAEGAYIDDRIALGHARLSIIDLEGGLQPLTNEDESLWLICNGEVFNYVELQAELQQRGHRFRTASDCETILHLYEERGPDCLHALNGQFAFALWDRNREQLMLARDRLGIRPLYYTNAGGYLIFGSEIKALLTHPDVPRELDPVALAQVFTTWSPVPPRTMFNGVQSLRPGHLMLASDAGVEVREYWSLRFPYTSEAAAAIRSDEAAEHLRSLLLDSTRLRLRADVPVGAYVSGGLDSSIVTALARRYTTNTLQTFAVAFNDAEYDERHHQESIAGLLGTQHHTIVCEPADVARVLPDVVWHTEAPLVRTAPAPLYLLASLVRQHGFKVVLTGEGADEFLLGYDVFKEARVRAFWARQPGSRFRPLLLRRLYGHIPELAKPSQAYLQTFFGSGLDLSDAPEFSHALRWSNTRRLHRYFSSEFSNLVDGTSTHDLDRLMAEQDPDWDVIARAQFNEVTTFLDPYLLSSQGDRVAMAHAVEGRFPFLDYRVVEFCNTLPPGMKMSGLKEKALLKRAAADLLPAAILARTKQPFRAPIRPAFVGEDAPHYVHDLLHPERVAADGVFKPHAVTWLVERARNHSRLSETENMALVGIISFGLFKRAFWEEFSQRAVFRASPSLVADFRSSRGVREMVENSYTRRSGRGERERNRRAYSRAHHSQLPI